MARPAAPPAEWRESGRIVASYGRTVMVEDATGRRLPCRLHGRKLSAVCGDAVSWARDPAGDAEGIVHEIEPRRSLLMRLAGNGRSEPVVANLTQLVAMVAVRPAPDWAIVDRYLAGAAWCGIRAVVACNKAELGVPPAMGAELDVYAAIGYRLVQCSARAAGGLGALSAALAGESSVLVGQSGTGKSSLLNALVPEARAVTQEISAATEEGRHTTTSSVLHRLAGGGDLIDSPGVRDFSPPLPAPRSVASGYVEIAALAGLCRFADCLHLEEPGCAVRAARAAGRIWPRRFDSYRGLLALAREFAARPPPRAPRGFR